MLSWRFQYRARWWSRGQTWWCPSPASRRTRSFLCSFSSSSKQGWWCCWILWKLYSCSAGMTLQTSCSDPLTCTLVKSESTWRKLNLGFYYEGCSTLAETRSSWSCGWWGCRRGLNLEGCASSECFLLNFRGRLRIAWPFLLSPHTACILQGWTGPWTCHRILGKFCLSSSGSPRGWTAAAPSFASPYPRIRGLDHEAAHSSCLWVQRAYRTILLNCIHCSYRSNCPCKELYGWHATVDSSCCSFPYKPDLSLQCSLGSS